MDKTFAVSVALVADLFIGFGLGYALRASISRRRHRRAQQRRML
jgi:hypothetical protein